MGRIDRTYSIWWATERRLFGANRDEWLGGANGRRHYLPIIFTCEKPFSPSFIILHFNGTLEDWLDLERQNEASANGNPVDEQTIRDITIAEQPAKVYQRAVTGTGYVDYYAVNLDNNRLLFIVSENVSFAKYNAVVDGLRFKTAPSTLPDTGAQGHQVLILLGAVLVLGSGLASRTVVWQV